MHVEQKPSCHQHRTIGIELKLICINDQNACKHEDTCAHHVTSMIAIVAAVIWSLAAAASAVPSAESPATVAEQCLRGGLSSVLYSCPGYDGGLSSAPGSSNMRDGMVRLLQSCLLAKSINATQTTSIRLLLPLSHIAQLIVNLTSLYQKVTGIKVEDELPTPAQYIQARALSINNPTNRSLSHDAWLITPSGLGDGMASYAFLDLSQLVLYDQKLQWQGIVDQMRAVGLVYGSKVVALPISGYSFSLFYRTDTFKSNNWTVPTTWRGLIRLAQRINGTNDMWGFCGMWGSCGSLGTNLFKYILASYHQTTGASQGWLIDPDTMKLMLDSPAVKETLDILQALFQASPVDTVTADNCSQALTPFANGQCHMMISIGSLFKFVSHSSNLQWAPLVQGNLGTALLPGSSRVLDRATNTLVPCDEERCPYAVKEMMTVNGTSTRVSINQSPGFEASLIPINAQSPATIQFYAFSMTSYLARPEISDQLVYDPLAEALPTRTSQLQATTWQSAGYNLADAARYCNAHSASMSHPNMHVQIRIPGASSFVTLFSQLMTGIIQSNDTSAVAAGAQAAGQTILDRTYRGNATALKLEYWSSLNKIVPSFTPSPEYSPSVTTLDQQQGTDTTEHQNVAIILAVVLPTGGLILIALIAWVVLTSRNHGANSPPGLGPDTTLLVTDIENSTTLWEELDPRVMDTAAKLHNACIRNLAASKQGYESVWEGDSFVIAFPSALAALEFATQAQTALLALDWPSALLAHRHACELRMIKQSAGEVPDSAAMQPETIRRKVKKTFSFQYYKDMLHRPAQERAQVLAGLPTLVSQTETKPEMPFSNSFECPLYTPEALALGSDDDIMVPTGHATSNGRGYLALHLYEQQDEERAIHNSHRDVDASPTLQHCPEPSSAGSSKPARDAAVQQHASGLSDTSKDPWTLHRQLQAEWRKARRTVVDNSQAASIVAFRGLRVRIGFHAGHHKESDVVFNPASGRYVFTGSFRAAANAVASAGMGGHVLMSSSTAARLGKDKAGLLRHLPEDVCVYHMGTHLLDGLGDKPVQLIWALHKSLTCRMVAVDTRLRTHAQLAAGCLSAPTPGPHRTASVVLLGLTISGLDTLMNWNMEEALTALQQCAKVIMEELQACNGAVSESGILAALESASCTQGEGSGQHTALSREELTPGRVLLAFSKAEQAVQFAASVREQLLDTAWSDQLLANPLCEKVGHRRMGIDFGSREESEPGAHLADEFMLHMPSSISMTRPSAIISFSMCSSGMALDPQMSESQGRIISLTLRMVPHLESQCSSSSDDSDDDTLLPHSSRLSRAPFVPPSHVARESQSGRPRDSEAGTASPCAPESDDSCKLLTPPFLISNHNLHGALSSQPPRPWRSRPSSLSGHVQSSPLAPSTPRESEPGSHRLKQRQVACNSKVRFTGELASVALPASTATEARYPVSAAPSTFHGSATTAAAFHTSDSPFLCGPRIRVAIVTGPVQVHVATRSTGRPIYKDSKTLKRLHKLLQQATAGQILIDNNVMPDISQYLS